jgi:hypothetical protein
MTSNGVPLMGAFAGYLLGSRTLVTASGSYTPPATARILLVEAVGGGGSGGMNATNSSAGQIVLGSGGGSGAYSAAICRAQALTLVVGPVRTAGGQNGVASTAAFTSSGVIFVNANAGTGGSNVATGSTQLYILGGAGGLAAAGSAAGDLKIDGNTGGTGRRISGTIGCSGEGAPSYFGGMGKSVIAQGNGVAGGNYGAGGSGGFSVNAGGVQTGGLGAAGVILVSEFY